MMPEDTLSTTARATAACAGPNICTACVAFLMVTLLKSSVARGGVESHAVPRLRVAPTEPYRWGANLPAAPTRVKSARWPANGTLSGLCRRRFTGGGAPHLLREPLETLLGVRELRGRHG